MFDGTDSVFNNYSVPSNIPHKSFKSPVLRLSSFDLHGTTVQKVKPKMAEIFVHFLLFLSARSNQPRTQGLFGWLRCVASLLD